MDNPTPDEQWASTELDRLTDYDLRGLVRYATSDSGRRLADVLIAAAPGEKLRTKAHRVIHSAWTSARTTSIDAGDITAFSSVANLVRFDSIFAPLGTLAWRRALAATEPVTSSTRRDWIQVITAFATGVMETDERTAGLVPLDSDALFAAVTHGPPIAAFHPPADDTSGRKRALGVIEVVLQGGFLSGSRLVVPARIAGTTVQMGSQEQSRLIDVIHSCSTSDEPAGLVNVALAAHARDALFVLRSAAEQDPMGYLRAIIDCPTYLQENGGASQLDADWMTFALGEAGTDFAADLQHWEVSRLTAVINEITACGFEVTGTHALSAGGIHFTP